MPVVPSPYQAPWFLRNGHSHTVFPVFFRKLQGVRYQRSRLELMDGDFLDLDWSRTGSDKAVIVSHGLEGSSARAYVQGMVRALNRDHWDAVALNFRGCSGEPNRLLRFYHSGVSDDLWQVAQHVASLGYRRVNLVGFSLGGNVTLKLLGEVGGHAPPWLGGGVGISVPCDLKASSQKMARLVNRPYMMRFIRDLRGKLRAKKDHYPGHLDDSGYRSIKTFQQFDDRYTAPLHGFRNAEDYWAQSSSLRFLREIERPTLLLNAADDPFLAPSCFPYQIAHGHRRFHLEVPPHGGHVGFVGGGQVDGEYYSERRAVDFFREND